MKIVRLRYPFAFFGFLLLLLFSDSSGVLHCTAAAICLHEGAHGLFYRMLTGLPPIFTVSPGGIALFWRENVLSRKKRIGILLAGPASNLLAAGICWGLVQQKAHLTLYLFGGVNFLLCAFSLLPISLLDGGRLLSCLLEKRMDAARLDRVLALVQKLCLAGLLIVIFAFSMRMETKIALFAFLAYFCSKTFFGKN